MEPPAIKFQDLSPIGIMKLRRNSYKEKMQQIVAATEKRSAKTRLTAGEKKLLRSENEIQWLIDEYDIIFAKIDATLSKHHRLPASEDVNELVPLMYCGSLLGTSSTKETEDESDWKLRETKKFGLVRKESRPLEVLGNHLRLIENKGKHADSLKERIEYVKRIIEPGYSTCSEINTALVKLLKSDNFCSPKNTQEFGIGCNKKKWIGGGIRHWIESFREEMVQECAFPYGKYVLKEARLTDTSRYIIRGIMKQVMHFHERGKVFGGLTCENIFVDNDFHIKLRGGMPGDDKRNDCHSLSGIIRTILDGNCIPKDVDHLIELLQNYNCDNYNVIFHHSCLWKPNEMLANIILIRAVMGGGPEAKSIWDDVALVQEEATNWTSIICQHELYMSILARWKSELSSCKDTTGQYNALDYVPLEERRKMGKGAILSYFRSILSHIHQHRENHLNRNMLLTERDLFVVFPLYMPHLLICTRSQGLIKNIYKSEL